MKIQNTIFSLLIFLSFSQSSLSAECSAKSAKHVVPLLELYTSEGCSSCPPADQWMSNIKNHKVTPLAFHVDYWDYIGWKDRFSKAEFSERQRRLARNAGQGIVYTPQFVLSGRDFRSWNSARLDKIIDISQKIPSSLDLSLDALTNTNGEITLKANVQSHKPQTVKPNDIRNLEVYIALYENKLSSQVNAGENNGSELKHDYVVREFFGAYAINAQNQFSKSFNLNKVWMQKDAGAVIFVQNAITGEVIQSLALPFCAYLRSATT